MSPIPSLPQFEDTSLSEAIRAATELQRRLAAQVDVSPKLSIDACRFVASADVSFDLGSSLVFASVVVTAMPSRQIVETQIATQEVNFPYIPGFLSFRELPPIVAAFKKV